jgi:hypothetical protein
VSSYIYIYLIIRVNKHVSQYLSGLPADNNGVKSGNVCILLMLSKNNELMFSNWGILGKIIYSNIHPFLGNLFYPMCTEIA